jgi:hypothetical protein
MATDTPPALPVSTSKFATISAVISSAGAVVAAACAIISTNQVLKAVQIDAQEKVFALKLDACDSFDETTTTISTNPMVAASNDENRLKVIHSANRLIMLFPDHVRDAGQKFINQMDVVYAARHGGAQDVPLSMKLGSLLQATVELEQACQDDIRKSAHSPE